MCGRFIQISDPTQIKVYFSELEVDADAQKLFMPSYNIAPTRDILTVLNTPMPRLTLVHWGLIPHWAKDKSIGNKMINARAETLTSKPSFKEPFKKRRCIVFADGFYEWDSVHKTKTPYFIRMKDRKPFAFACLWDHWKNEETEKPLLSSTIITTDANALIAQIHTRMPVILRPDSFNLWLSSQPEPEDALMKCLKPYPAEEIEVYKVSKEVNNPLNDFPDLIKPSEDNMSIS